MSPDKITKLVSHATFVDVGCMLGSRRKRSYVQARHMAWWLIYKHTPLSYAEIGELYDRDHTSVMHGIKRVDDGYLDGGFNKIREELNATITYSAQAEIDRAIRNAG